MTPIVEVRNGTKEYRGVPAVKDVSFTLDLGEVHALSARTALASRR